MFEQLGLFKKNMHLKKILFFFIISSLNGFVFAQTISNVSAIQDQNNIVVSYNLESKVPCKISLYVSLKNGEWKGPLKQVKGNIGDNIKAGENNILWDVLSEFTEFKGNDISFKVETEDMIKKVGDYYQGGIIVFIENGHGIIATPNDLGCLQWKFAKIACENLILNDYSDWYLPSLNELQLLYENKDKIGGFKSDYYWSSKEYDSKSRWKYNFNKGSINLSFDHLDYFHVRPIRAF